LEKVAATVGLEINMDNTKFMKMNTLSPTIVQLTNVLIEEVDKFTYLRSVVSTTAGTDQDVQARLGKARSAFRAMNKLWTS